MALDAEPMPKTPYWFHPQEMRVPAGGRGGEGAADRRSGKKAGGQGGAARRAGGLACRKDWQMRRKHYLGEQAHTTAVAVTEHPTHRWSAGQA